jgi:hypothetical protein
MEMRIPKSRYKVKQNEGYVLRVLWLIRDIEVSWGFSVVMILYCFVLSIIALLFLPAFAIFAVEIYA